MHKDGARIRKNGTRFVVVDLDHGRVVENTSSLEWALYRYLCMPGGSGTGVVARASGIATGRKVEAAR